QRHAVAGEIVADMEYQFVGAGTEAVTLEQGPVAAAVGIGGGARQPLAGGPQATQVDLDARARPAVRGIQDVRRQTPHCLVSMGWTAIPYCRRFSAPIKL